MRKLEYFQRLEIVGRNRNIQLLFYMTKYRLNYELVSLICIFDVMWDHLQNHKIHDSAGAQLKRRVVHLCLRELYVLSEPEVWIC